MIDLDKLWASHVAGWRPKQSVQIEVWMLAELIEELQRYRDTLRLPDDALVSKEKP